MALINKLKAIADAIRAKTGGTEELTLDQMPGEIESISGGGQQQAPVKLQSKEVTITENGFMQISADEGYKGLSRVDLTVEVYDNFATSYQEDTQTIVITSPQYIETLDTKYF